MSDDEDDPGVWIPKEVADKYTDNQIGRWFMNKYLIMIKSLCYSPVLKT